MSDHEGKFRNLYETLKSKILSGQYGSGNPLPSVRAIMNRTGLSSSTVRHAFAELERVGLVVRTRGRGTSVTKTAMSRKIGLIVPGICYSEVFPPICKELSRLAQHMVDEGVRNVVFLAAPHSDYSVQNRIEGVRNAVAVAKGHFRNLSVDVKDAVVVKKLLSRRPRPEAIICRNDDQAAHLLVTLRSLGRRVPEDVLVAGFNDVSYASIVSPSLTTVHLPCEDIARQAFAFLRERIGNPEIPTRECYMSAPLVVRGSTILKCERK